MSDLDSEVYPRHAMVYHTKAGTTPNRNAQIAFKSVLGKKRCREFWMWYYQNSLVYYDRIKKPQLNNTYPIIGNTYLRSLSGNDYSEENSSRGQFGTKYSKQSG